ncbi:M23 family metallopeptidase [Rhodococcoides fascians]|uniref:M23 family metallopeptidase n=1 Tax=Rhodococcoides fascians TaxID=1828 RepID=UPI00056D1B32|nr:M23 family metallopeptidase [Rhodococcus fascians]
MSDRGGSSALTAVAIAAVGVLLGAAVLAAFLAQDEQDRAAASTDCLPGTSQLGAAPGNLLAAPGSFIKPVDPTSVTFTSGFGTRWGTQHQGIDLAGPIGTPIYAAADGTVYAAGEASGFGQWVVLDHVLGGKTVSTVYGHIDTYSVAAGQPVRAGQQIATIGNRGQSTGPHLHFEIWDGGHAGGSAIDPLAQYEAAPAPGAAPPARAPSAPVSAPAPAPVDQLAGTVPGAGGDLSTPTPASMGDETNLQVGTKRVMRALALKFGTRLDALGGWRANGGAADDHPQGRAVDAMIGNYSSGDGVALGNEILDYVMANADFFHLEYAIWRQTIHFPGQEPSLMEDRGSDNENHMNHVHITVDASGFDDAGAVWGQLPGGPATGPGASAAAPGCTTPGAGFGEDLAAGTVPAEFEPWLRKAGGICPQIKSSLLAAQLDAENGFSYGPSAPVSNTGAGGPAQFMPGTWASYGKDYDGDGSIDINSIGDAVMAQGKYMCDIAGVIDAGIADGRVSAPNGPTELYLAGYNAGEGAVLSSGGFPTGSNDYIVQTRPYADKIIAAEPTFRSQNS